MDTTNENPRNTTIITLDLPQYFLYQTSQIDVHGPDGRYIQSIGKAIQNDLLEDSRYRFQEQLELVVCLLSNVNDDLHLPMSAVLGLADLLCRTLELGKAR